MNYLTIALAKGRLASISADMFGEIGFDVSELKEKSRKLIFTDEKNKVKFILVKAGDVPVYVEYGAADIGIVGRDTILEEGRNLYEMLDLDFGKCKMAVCGHISMKEKLDSQNNLRVASKYPNITREHFHINKGKTVEIVPLSGSVELAPLTGLSDVIVDIVESGKTLEENNLTVLEDICTLSAWLIVNRISIKLEKERIMDIVMKLKKLIELEKDK